jgi:hypothetical protein
MDAQGMPSSQFAQPVARAMASWDPERVKVFHVPDLKSVIYTHEGEAFAFNVQNLTWSSPAMLSDFAEGEAVSGVVIDRRLKICMYDEYDGSFDLYDFDEPPSESPSTNFRIVAPDGKLNPGGRVNVLGVKATFQTPEAGNFNVKAVVDYGARSKTLIHAASAEGMQETKLSRWYLPRAEAVRVEFEGTQTDFTKDCYLAGVQVFGVPEDSNRITG